MAAAVHAESRPGYGGQLVTSLSSEPVSIDPTRAHTLSELAVIGLVFDSLYRTLPNGDVVANLAVAAPELDAAGTTVHIAIRDGVHFHDGTVLTAADVEASLVRLKSSEHGYLLAGVTKIASAGNIVTLSLRAPTSDLALRLAAPQAAIVAGGKAPTDKAVNGTGPFAWQAIDRAHHRVTMRAFDDAFAGRPYLDTIELDWFTDADGEARRYETGGAHVSSRGATAFSGHQPKYRTRELEGPATLLSFVGFGHGHNNALAQPNFRRALDLALVRTGLSSLSAGERVTPARSPLPAELGGAAGTLENESEIEASRLASAVSALHDAGAAAPIFAEKNRATLRLEIIIDETRPSDHLVAERVSRALDKLGIASNITALPALEADARISNGSCDLYINELAIAAASPALEWAAGFAMGGDSWAEAGLATGHLDSKVAAAAFAKRLPIVAVLHRASRFYYRDTLRGASVDLAGRLGYADLFFAKVPATHAPVGKPSKP